MYTQHSEHVGLHFNYHDPQPANHHTQELQEVKCGVFIRRWLRCVCVCVGDDKVFLHSWKVNTRRQYREHETKRPWSRVKKNLSVWFNGSLKQNVLTYTRAFFANENTDRNEGRVFWDVHLDETLTNATICKAENTLIVPFIVNAFTIMKVSFFFFFFLNTRNPAVCCNFYSMHLISYFTHKSSLLCSFAQCAIFLKKCCARCFERSIENVKLMSR